MLFIFSFIICYDNIMLCIDIILIRLLFSMSCIIFIISFCIVGYYIQHLNVSFWLYIITQYLFLCIL